MSKSRKNNADKLVFYCLLAIGVIVALFIIEKKRRSFNDKFDSRKEALINKAHNRSDEYFRNFETDLDSIISSHSTRMKKAAETAAKNGSTYTSTSFLVGHIVYDMVARTNTADGLIQKKMEPLFDEISALDSLSQKRIEELESKLRHSTLQLAGDISALQNPEISSQKFDGSIVLSDADFDKALGNLGFDSARILVSTATTIAGLYDSKLIPVIVEKVKDLAGRIFKKQIAKGAASAAAAAVDGPLPVGDVIAALGLLWTTAEIYKARSDFEYELKESLLETTDESLQQTKIEIKARAVKLIEYYSELQTEIGNT